MAGEKSEFAKQKGHGAGDLKEKQQEHRKVNDINVRFGTTIGEMLELNPIKKYTTTNSRMNTHTS